MNTKPKRIAANRIHFPDGRVLVNHVVELDGMFPVATYPLTEEMAFTEWHGGDFYIVPSSSSRSR